MRPRPTKRNPGRCASEGPCDPLANKMPSQSRQRGALLRGVGKTTRRVFSETTPGPCRKRVAAKTKQRGKNEKNQTQETRKHPCRLAALASKTRGLRTGTRRIPKTRWAQNGTPKKTPRNRMHGQKGRKTKRGGTKKTKPVRAGAFCY